MNMFTEDRYSMFVASFLELEDTFTTFVTVYKVFAFTVRHTTFLMIKVKLDNAIFYFCPGKE